jgi:hypothetical protein
MIMRNYGHISVPFVRLVSFVFPLTLF